MDRRHILEAGIGNFPAATNSAWGSARVPKRLKVPREATDGANKERKGRFPSDQSVHGLIQDEQYGMTAADG
jgi:hypothetical protein